MCQMQMTARRHEVKQMNEEKQNTLVDLGNIGMIDLPTFDVKEYIGKESTIESATTHQGQFGYYVKVETKKVAEFGDKEIKASKIFGLQEDENQKIGWGAETKLGLYLAKMKVTHFKDLVGKKVILQSRTNKDGNDFLDFN